MAHVRLFHWKAQEAERFIRSLRAAGHQVAYDEKIVRGLFPKIRSSPPDAFVIALSRLPRQGRDVAALLRASKPTRPVPIVFADGVPEKVEDIRRQIPDAVYTSLAHLNAALKKALANPPDAPIVPPQVMERFGARTTAQKLGIAPGATVGLLDAPRDYESVLGSMPDGVNFVENGTGDCSVTLWFVTDAGVYRSLLPHRRALAARSKFWILWPKGGRGNGISSPYVRETANSVGLVDYKICSVNDRWSAMAFAKRKA